MTGKIASVFKYCDIGKPDASLTTSRQCGEGCERTRLQVDDPLRKNGFLPVKGHASRSQQR